MESTKIRINLSPYTKNIRKKGSSHSQTILSHREKLIKSRKMSSKPENIKPTIKHQINKIFPSQLQNVLLDLKENKLSLSTLIHQITYLNIPNQQQYNSSYNNMNELSSKQIEKVNEIQTNNSSKDAIHLNIALKKKYFDTINFVNNMKKNTFQKHQKKQYQTINYIQQNNYYPNYNVYVVNNNKSKQQEQQSNQLSIKKHVYNFEDNSNQNEMYQKFEKIDKSEQFSSINEETDISPSLFNSKKLLLKKQSILSSNKVQDITELFSDDLNESIQQDDELISLEYQNGFNQHQDDIFDLNYQQSQILFDPFQ